MSPKRSRRDISEHRRAVPLNIAPAKPQESDDQKLPMWRRFTLSGEGVGLVAVAIAGHLAAPIAAPCIIVGGGLFAVGLAFNRGIKSLSVSPKGRSQSRRRGREPNDRNRRRCGDLTERRLALVRHWTGNLQRINADIGDAGMTYVDAASVVADFIRSGLADLTQEFKTPRETIRASLGLVEPSGDCISISATRLGTLDSLLHPVKGSWDERS